MAPLRNPPSFLRSFATGATLSVAAVSPARAALSFAWPLSLPFDVTTLPPQDILLWGSVALLIVALTAKVIQDRHRGERLPEGPDLRWWKNPPPSSLP